MSAEPATRKVWNWEHERIRSHLLRLGNDDRRLRFCRPVNDDFIHRYCDAIDWRLSSVVGFFADGALRGVAELVRIPHGVPAGAEIALSVEAPWQGRGIGGALLRRALLLAQNRLVGTVHMVSLHDNPRVQRLVRRLGARIETHENDAEGHLRLPLPSHLSLLEELAGDGRGLISAMFELPLAELARGAGSPPALQGPGWPR